MQVNQATQAMQLDALLKLVQHRWNIPVIAVLQRRNGAKFVTLANELKCSRSALSVALKYLQHEGIVVRNPGYGHPLRPEYLLNQQCEQVGVGCLNLFRLMERRQEVDLAFRKWSLPAVAVIGQHAVGFNELRESLGSPSPRAITLTLQALRSHQWVERCNKRKTGPVNAYFALPKSRRVLAHLADLDLP